MFLSEGAKQNERTERTLQANQYLGFPDSQSWNIVENEGPDGTSDGVLEGLPAFSAPES